MKKRKRHSENDFGAIRLTPFEPKINKLKVETVATIKEENP